MDFTEVSTTDGNDLLGGGVLIEHYHFSNISSKVGDQGSILSYIKLISVLTKKAIFKINTEKRNLIYVNYLPLIAN